MLTKSQTRFVSFTFACILSALGPLYGQGVVTSPSAPPPSPIDFEMFADLVEDEVDGNCTGWQFTIHRGMSHKVSRKGGQARTSQNSPAREMWFSDRLEVGSCSKTITAVAALDILNEKGISIHEPIIDYLPDNWEIHHSIDHSITFKHVMSHTTGLSMDPLVAIDAFFGEDLLWDEGVPGAFTANMKILLEYGTWNPVGKYEYQNVNYGLLRHLICHIVDPEIKQLAEDDDLAEHDWACANRLANETRVRVFQPAGLGLFVFPYEWHPAGSSHNYARYYDFSDPTKAGVIQDQEYSGIGSGQWEMTSSQLTKVISALEAGLLLPPAISGQSKPDFPADYETMQKHNLGMFRKTSSTGYGDLGAAYEHSGGVPMSDDRGAVSQWVAFPENIQFAIAVNSRNNTFSDDNDIFVFVADAFSDAMDPPDVIPKTSLLGKPRYEGSELVIPLEMEIINQGRGPTYRDFVNTIRVDDEIVFVSETSHRISARRSDRIDATVRISDPRGRFAGQTITLHTTADANEFADHGRGSIKESDDNNNRSSLQVVIPSMRRR